MWRRPVLTQIRELCVLPVLTIAVDQMINGQILAGRRAEIFMDGPEFLWFVNLRDGEMWNQNGHFCVCMR